MVMEPNALKSETENQQAVDWFSLNRDPEANILNDGETQFLYSLWLPKVVHTDSDQGTNEKIKS